MALKYDSSRAIYDGGVDYPNVNQHVLLVKAKTSKAKFLEYSAAILMIKQNTPEKRWSLI
jgi:hypothetical protein